MEVNIREEYSTNKFEDKLKEILKTLQKKSPIILIQGGYGKNNLGDDALLLTISKNILKILPKSQIVALCHYPENVKKLYGIDAVYFSEKRAFDFLRKCDVLIIGGGGIVNKINTYSGFHFFKIFDPKGKYLFLTSLFTKLRRKKVVFYGVGMTSIPDRMVAFLMKITLKKVDLLSVREKVSYNMVKKYAPNKEVIVMHDPALNYDYEITQAQKKELQNYFNLQENYIIISTRSVYDSDITQNVKYLIIKLIKNLLEDYPQFKIVILPVSMHPEKILENDYLISKDIYKAFPDNEKIVLINKYFHPSQVRRILEFSKLIIMTRLHGVILSYDFQVPTVILAYDNKVKCFGEMANYKYILDYNKLNYDILKGSVYDFLELEGCNV